MPTHMNGAMRHLIHDAFLLAWIMGVGLADASMEGFSCDTTRNTGYANHRSLHLPSSYWDSASDADRAWAVKLCCVFTWVVRDPSTTTPFMISYDGGRFDYQASTFSLVAENAYSAVCGMSMGSSDCASEAERCPITPRKYDPVGMLCRPKNNDGYAISTQVVSASACRDKCEADAERCGAFEYEYVAGDDRECELHEKAVVSRTETAAMGACLLKTQGADVMLDPPVLGQYRCCWIWDGASLASSSTTTTTATMSIVTTLVSVALANQSQQERSTTSLTSTSTSPEATTTTEVPSTSAASFKHARFLFASVVVLAVNFPYTAHAYVAKT